ncbi:tRNA (adenosine(37)-N6)-threonylcarbamoyltransferase complex transferase subunit TsaD [Candidatus Kirkpatrickella diaphorinae]|uniref:tRNA N6-adenosine threonylcarbamoyltransferase n=1 Tax=Candidatus Kirkpatrickella diaphorinae TaxID=2984322 RepID=A0ABY6GLI2_9PROT|nr:tRNA (adenosine(37)-N6)-threonylcarbamoyltransferase complex transferase subunit TsaD [Candidatus Kirkpatrickella diaphorinae]UYH52139.1 tRNA (adenosine(37)-N6)-threonylcarbamoyltransferase complex transferase subunit TsaD [Candidatus Kirkpatrickella diaphorinae]
MTASLSSDSSAAINGHAPILAIESSCDDTACAIMLPDGQICADRIYSQNEHAALGGVVPEIAARAHLAHLPDLVSQCLSDAGYRLSDMGAFAATTGPGLIGGLIVGSHYAKGLALAMNRPFIAINHIEAHALMATWPLMPGGGAPFPFLLLLVSGGHCQCVAVRDIVDYTLLGSTIDDAAGEAFDKVAKMLGLGWPGGPALEMLAREGDARQWDFPRPLVGRAGCDFSFSGLKTAVSRVVSRFGAEALTRRDAANIAASFQASVARVMADRVRNGLSAFPEAKNIVVAGGVAANQAIRNAIEAVAQESGLPLFVPPVRYCTDNAVMIAWAAWQKRRAHPAAAINDLNIAPRPRWPLDEMRPNPVAPG